MMTIPRAFIDQNGLGVWSEVAFHFSGKKISIETPNCPRYKLPDLMVKMPDDFPMVKDWNEISPLGMENILFNLSFGNYK